MKRTVTEALGGLGICCRKRVHALMLLVLFASAGCQDMSTQEALTCFGTVVLGASVGALADKGKGAAVGAAAGVAACIVIHLVTHRTKDASQVDSEYKSAHNGQLPVQPTIVALDVQAQPSGVVRQGGQLTIVTNFEAVSGRNQPITAVTAQVNLYENGANQDLHREPADPAWERRISNGLRDQSARFDAARPVQGGDRVLSQQSEGSQPVCTGAGGVVRTGSIGLTGGAAQVERKLASGEAVVFFEGVCHVIATCFYRARCLVAGRVSVCTRDVI
jgi:hypothetical protein